MAANSHSRGFAIFGRKFIKQHWSGNFRDPAPIPSASVSSIRKANFSYDKNLDDKIRPSVVPDDVIEPQSDKYWAPHPKTGVFGPTTDHNGPASGETELPADGGGGGGGGGSVLELKAWIRPHEEDIEKHHHA